MHQFYFCQGEVQSHIYQRWASRAVALCFFCTLKPLILFLRRSSPLTADLCLSESRSLSTLAALQAARRKPLLGSLGYSRRSGLLANDTYKCCQAQARSEGVYPMDAPTSNVWYLSQCMLKPRLRRRKRDRTMASCECFSIYVLSRNVSRTSSAPHHLSHRLSLLIFPGSDTLCED
jgi:hypothetical protein